MAKKTSGGMDLRSRISIAFLLVIIIPVILTSVTFFCLLNYKLKQFGEAYGIENPGIESLYNNALLISTSMDEELAQIKETFESDPNKIEDEEFLTEINESLNENGAFLIIRKEREIYFNGSADLTNEKLEQMLPSIEESSETSDEIITLGDTSSGSEGTADDTSAAEKEEDASTADEESAASSSSGTITGNYLEVNNQALLKQVNFTFADGSQGYLYLVSQLNKIAPELKNTFAETILIILLILSITCLFMGIWIYRSVMKPINNLKMAAQNIRDGNLDFEVQGSDVEEINDLCGDFEEMRIRLKESAEKKVEYDSQSKELISNISHDLKTPVTAIKGYAEGIIDGVADTPEKKDKYVRTIYNKTIEITRLIDELTTYSRIDTNRIPYNFTRIHVNAYFADCNEELSMELEQQGIRLNYFNYLKDDAIIIADPEQLRRVINNIIGNSVKYMDKPQGVINIRLRDVGDFVQVEIEDNGKGIAQKDITRIFDRFYRSDTARQSRGGSGIGLSIVRKILEDHEGKVWATSKEGVGTVIYFVLRKYEDPENASGTN